MNVAQIRQELQIGKRIEEIPLRVTFYARVSTGKDEQLNSLDAQKKTYTDLIQRNPNWTFVDGYIDEGISGKSLEGRGGFAQMMEDAKNGLFDLILTKEISRFSRDTVDSLLSTRTLLGYGVGVKFESDGILTFDLDGELRLTIMSSIAQDELRKISSRVKRGFRSAIEQKNSVLGNNNIWGYDKYRQTLPDGSTRAALKINEEQAEMVRLIFDLYAIKHLGIRRVCEEMTKRGYKNSNGKPFTFSTIRKILVNPKYAGYYVGKKTSKDDYQSKVITILPQSEWVMFRDESGELVPAIVSEELWNQANAILKSNREKMISENPTSYQNKYAYSGKIVCGQHGTFYYHAAYTYRSGQKKEVWQCKLYNEKGKTACDNPLVYTSELDQIMRKAVQVVLKNRQQIIEDLIELYAHADDIPERKEQIAKVDRTIKDLQKKLDKLLDAMLDGTITKEQFKKKGEELRGKLDEQKQIMADLQEDEQKTTDLKASLQTLRDVIDNQLDFEDEMPASVVDTLLDRIEVYKTGDPKTVDLKVFFKIVGDVSYTIDRKHGLTSVCSTSST